MHELPPYPEYKDSDALGWGKFRRIGNAERQNFFLMNV